MQLFQTKELTSITNIMFEEQHYPTGWGSTFQILATTLPTLRRFPQSLQSSVRSLHKYGHGPFLLNPFQLPDGILIEPMTREQILSHE
jgi:hypothetical protein